MNEIKIPLTGVKPVDPGSELHFQLSKQKDLLNPNKKKREEKKDPTFRKLLEEHIEKSSYSRRFRKLKSSLHHSIKL